jgi:DNA-binding XRE family transcriptional regulator
MMKKNWFWDIPVGEEKIKEALSNGEHPKFLIYAAKLFSRVREAKEAFCYVDKITFCKKWPAIKKLIRKDAWNSDAPKFWQTIYETVKDGLRAEGIKIRVGKKRILSECLVVAEQIKIIRKEKGYTQKELADKMNVIQQYISAIESGRENFSVETLAAIAGVLDKKLTVRFE